MHAAEHHGDPQAHGHLACRTPVTDVGVPGRRRRGIPVYASGHELSGRLHSTVQKAWENLLRTIRCHRPAFPAGIDSGVAIGVVGSSPHCSAEAPTRWMPCRARLYGKPCIQTYVWPTR